MTSQLSDKNELALVRAAMQMAERRADAAEAEISRLRALLDSERTRLVAINNAEQEMRRDAQRQVEILEARLAAVEEAARISRARNKGLEEQRGAAQLLADHRFEERDRIASRANALEERVSGLVEALDWAVIALRIYVKQPLAHGTELKAEYIEACKTLNEARAALAEPAPAAPVEGACRVKCAEGCHTCGRGSRDVPCYLHPDRPEHAALTTPCAEFVSPAPPYADAGLRCLACGREAGEHDPKPAPVDLMEALKASLAAKGPKK